MPFRPGELLGGKYEVERVAGRMGLGFVVHVRHAELGQRLLLKCLSNEACRYPDAVARFLGGARAAMRLSSEYTARTIDAGRLASGAPYVVSEALAGCDLREMIRVRGVLTVSEGTDFVLQAAESLAEAHASGVVHKNLNLFTLFATRRPDGSPRIKVLDYGIAEGLRADPMRSNDVRIEATTMFGSNPMLQALGCSSPEQLRNHVDVDARADIWALGAVLHELLSGHPVYEAESVPGLLAMIAADPPTPITAVRSDVPAALESVILRCLEKHRNARFATVAELGVALRAFATPDAQNGVDRITRTLGRSKRPPSHASALVHVRHTPTPPSPIAPPVVQAPLPGSSWLVWSTLLVAFGLVFGTIAGVLIATRTGMLHREPLRPTVAAAMPKAESALPVAKSTPPAVVSSELALQSAPEAPKSLPPPSTAPASAPSSVEARPVARRKVRPTGEAKEAARSEAEARPRDAVAQRTTHRAKVASASTTSVEALGSAERDLFDSMR